MNNEMRSIIERYESIVKEMHLTLETMERLKVDSKHISEIHRFMEQFSGKEEFIGFINEIKKCFFYMKDEFTTKEAALYLGMSVSTLYKKTMNSEIPFYKPSSRHLYFKREELRQWMLQNRNATNEELQAEAALSDVTNLFTPKRSKHPKNKTKHQ